MPIRDLTAAETNALKGFADMYGRQWKACLRAAWLGETYKGQRMEGADTGILRRLRNELGSAWLAAYRLPQETLPTIATLVDGKAEAEAAGFASFNPGPHLLVEAPDGPLCVTIRTSAGRLLTIQLDSDESRGGSANFADIAYHTSGKVWDNNGTSVPQFDLCVWGGGQAAFDSRSAEGRSPTIATIMMHAHKGGGESNANP